MQTRIRDHAIWFKDISDPELLERFEKLAPDESLVLNIDGVVGRWKRMKNGKDGRPTFAIRPIGEMKTIWNEWFRKRRGERITLLEAQMADDYLKHTAELFSEWSSPEDEAAFNDL